MIHGAVGTADAMVKRRAGGHASDHDGHEQHGELDPQVEMECSF